MRIWMFRETGYKQILNRILAESETRGMVSRMAESIGCQRSYLSQVLHTKVQLTKDQGWAASRFLGFSPIESEYFETLVDLERAASKDYREHLENQLQKIRDKAIRIQQQFTESKTFKDNEIYDYCQDWIPCAVHLLTSIPEFQTARNIAKRLRLGLSKVESTLSLLQEQGQVELVGEKWVFSGSSRFIPSYSSYVFLHHRNWRDQAVEQAKEKNNNELHYTMVQTMSAEDVEKIKALIMEFISNTKKVADPSSPEVLTTLTLDFFQPRTHL